MLRLHDAVPCSAERAGLAGRRRVTLRLDVALALHFLQCLLGNVLLVGVHIGANVRCRWRKALRSRVARSHRRLHALLGCLQIWLVRTDALLGHLCRLLLQRRESGDLFSWQLHRRSRQCLRVLN